MPHANPEMGIADAMRGFAAAALVCAAVSLVRLSFDAYFSGLGLIRLLNGGILGLVVTTALTFIVMSVCGLPVWLLYRRLHISQWWQFALTGALVGAVLASRVDPNAYRNADYNRWARGQDTIRPILDATTFFLYAFGSSIVFWAAVYKRRRVPS